jgi:hypothetical protein
MKVILAKCAGVTGSITSGSNTFAGELQELLLKSVCKSVKKIFLIQPAADVDARVV